MSGVNQVAQGVSVFERLQNLFKQREQIHIATQRHHRLVFGDSEPFKIKGNIRAHCVKPVNCPRRLFRRSIDMGCGSSNYQQLILGYFVPSACNFAPSVTLGAIDENRLRASPFTRAGVSRGFRVISRVRGQQIPQQRMLQGGRQDGAWHHHDALPLETLVFLAPFRVWHNSSMQIPFPLYCISPASSRSVFNRNCPQAASISWPFSRRSVAVTCCFSSALRKASCACSLGRVHGNPSTLL